MVHSSTLKAIMKITKRDMARNSPFKIGSSLDNDASWSAEAKNKIKDILKEKKEPHEHALVFKIEKRRGKPVSLMGPFHRSEDELKLLCAKLKKKLGSGGTCKDSWMEFQGECRETLRVLIKEEGFRTKS